MTAQPLEWLRGRLFITTSECAQILEVDPRTLRRSIEARECPAVRISDTIRIPVGPFLQWAGIDPEDSEAPEDSEPAALAHRGTRNDIHHARQTGQSHDGTDRSV